MSHIEGPVLLGFGDFFVGGTKPSTRVKATATKKGKSSHKNALARSATNLKKLAKVATVAVKRAVKVEKLSKAPPPKTKPGSKTSVGAKPRVLTPKQKAAVAKREKAQGKTQAIVAKTKKAAVAAANRGKEFERSLRSATPEIRKFFLASKVKPTAIEFAAADAVGASAAPQEAPSPSRPDPRASRFFDDVVGAVDELDLGLSGDDLALTEEDISFDVEDDPAPVRGQPLSKEEAKVVHRTLPENAVIYQGDRGMPRDAYGSWDVFYGSNKNPNGLGWGFLWVGNKWLARLPERMKGWKGVLVGPKKRQSDSNSFGGIPGTFDTPKKIAENSIKREWGPLIGNPNGELKGLQFAMDAGENGEWFWQAEKAPTWATAVQDKALADLNRKNREAAAAAKAAADEAKALEQAAREEMIARQQEDQELAESKAESEALIEERKQGVQQSAADVMERQSEAEALRAEREAEAADRRAQVEYDREASKAEAELRRAEIEAARDAARLEAEERRAQLEYDREAARQEQEYARANPEQFYGPAAPREGYAEEGYAEEGYAEEYAPSMFEERQQPSYAEYLDERGIDEV